MDLKALCAHFAVGSTKTVVRVMKLMAVFLLCACLAAGATGFSQVTLLEKNAPLQQVFKKIRQQTGYDFLYSSELLQQAGKVSISLRNVSLVTAMENCLRDKPLTFRIIDKTVVISQKASPTTPLPFTLTPPANVRGVVSDEKKTPIPGVSVLVKRTGEVTVTSQDGVFSLSGINEGDTLQFTCVNYEAVTVLAGLGRMMNLTMKLRVSALEGVTVYNTGYQSLPKERATGSFSYISKESLDRRPLTNLLGKLEGMASGLSFSRTSYDDGQPKITIRGRSTIYANDQPLIVLDGFPIEGDIRDINPNDVESVTLLKDAAAASIWGTRAANGVIVVTTKKGGFNRKPEIEIINQATVGSKPDLFYLPQMSTSDYIDLETNWFNAGRYNSYATALPQNKPVLSQVASILMDKRNGKISAADADNQLNALRNIDVRNEATDVFFRNSIRQQHQVNLRGGGDKVNYYFSAGYDRVLGQERGDDMDRLTLKSENMFKLLPSLNLQVGFTSTWGKQYRNGMGLKGFQGNTANGFSITSSDYSLYPYQRLINADGSAAVAPRMFNKDYVDYLTGLGFEDWSYRPADELNHFDNKTQQKHLVVTAQLNYKLNNALSADLKYQYENQDLTTNNYQPVALYNTRNTINTYTRIVLPDSNVVKQVPYGDILDYALTSLTTHNFRGQLNFNKRWKDHQLAAIGGMEVREIITSGRTMRNYGYDNRTLTYANIDYNARYTAFPSGVISVPGAQTITYVQDRYVSYYANASYTYLNRYTVSASGRMDDSNLFGIDPKDRNVPLWSAGASWNIDKEAFFNNDLFSLLRLRSTYGFNGNISKTQTAYPVAVAARDNFTNLPVEAVTSAGNPYLQWEKMAQWNLAVDFSLLSDHLSGSVEWFSKKGLSLLGDQYLDPSSGFQTIRANSASMKGHGVDVELNLKVGNKVQWQSKMIFSYATDKITDVANLPNSGTYRYVNADKQLMPIVGRPVYSVYSFQWGGLDKDGNPQLIGTDGKTGNYNTILNSLPPDQLVYNGPALPVYTGGWSHSIRWKNFLLSTSFTFKAGYKFRRSSINYLMLNSNSHIMGNADYALRWQKPGDELITNVPALQPYNITNTSRDLAYLSSNILVEDASHIRWRDVSLNYRLPVSWLSRLPFKSAEFYVYMDNLGLVWRANKYGIDPDFVPLPYSVRLPDAMTTTLGLKLTL